MREDVEELERLVRTTLASPGRPAIELRRLRARAFALAKNRVGDPDAVRVLEWLESMLGALGAEPEAEELAPESDVFFSPGEQCLRAVLSAFADAREKVDVCVFTITDDRIARGMLAAHRRGTRLRVVTDNDKVHDRGSDIAELARAGIAVRVDRTEFHMHHKFALVDDRYLLNGSYNWTRSASANNDENVVVSREARLVKKFAAHFERLWAKFA